MIQFLKLIFKTSILFLVIISLYPGSIIGFFLYGDSSQQPNLISNPYGTSINHLIAYFLVSMFGFALYLKDKISKKLIFWLFFLAFVLEVLHLIIPGRSFEIKDLIGNILGVFVAYLTLNIYLLIKRYE